MKMILSTLLNSHAKAKCFMPNLLVVILLFQACTHSSDLPLQEVELNDTSDFSITDWQLIGPFQSDEALWVRSGPFNMDSINGALLFKEDAFTMFGLEESKLRSSDLKKMKLSGTGSRFTVPDTLFKSYHNLHGMIDLEHVVNTNKPGVIYAACILESPKDQDIVFLSGGDECAEIYVNGTRYKSPVQNPYRLVYQNYLFAKLKKGKNFILLKSSNTTKSWTSTGVNETWRHILNICSPRRFNDYYLKLEKMLIKKPAVPFQHPLVLHMPPHPVDPVVSVQIMDYSGKKVLTPDYSKRIDISSLPIGYYQLVLKTERDSYEQSFYYGDIYSGIVPYVSQAKKQMQESPSVELTHNLAPLVDRYDILYRYYMGNYFKISQRKQGQHYAVIDTFVTNPTRLIPLNDAKNVMLESVKIWRNPIAGIEFYNAVGDSVNKVPYVQSSSENQVLNTELKDSTLHLSPFNDAFLDTLYFAFKPGDEPEYMQLLTYDTLETREIDRRFVFLYKGIRDILTQNMSEANFRNMPGTHLRSFTSEIEEDQQYYIVQAPESIVQDTSPRPLVVVVPWVFNANYPFLRSFIVADIHVHEMYQWQVDLRDFIVVHTNARTYEQVVTEPLSINNVMRTIEQVRKDYPVDTTRIHLLAYCGGSELASSLAVKYPGKFASLGIVAGFAMNPGNHWTHSTYTLNFTENLKCIPTRIRHGELDTHTRPASMLYFLEVARKNGNTHIDFMLEKGLTFEAYPRLRHHEEMFDFFAKNQSYGPDSFTYSTAQNEYHKAYWLSIFPERTGYKGTVDASITGQVITLNTKQVKKCIVYPQLLPEPMKNKDLTVIVDQDTTTYKYPHKENITVYGQNYIGLQKNNLVEGPMLKVFSKKFLLVVGTKGNTQDQNATNALMKHLVNDWETKYHVRPRVKKDTEIDASDIENSNLILIGNQQNNLVFKNMYKKLPVRIEKDHIQLHDNTFTGAALGYYICYPNPLNPERYVVLWGGNSLSHVIPRKGIPAINGFYDYEIYAYENGYQFLLDNGYFNDWWTMLN